MSENLTTIVGFEEVRVTLDNGDTELVKVRKIKIKEMTLFLSSLGDDNATLGLYTGLTPEKIDELTVESQLLLLERGNAINFPSCAAYVAQKKNLMETLGPSATKIMALRDSVTT